MKTSIEKLTLQEIFALSGLIKNKCEKSPSVEETSQEIVKILYKTFVDEKGENEFALCRIFKSCLFKDLPQDIKEYVRQRESKKKKLDLNKYLVLMGTYGDKKEWRARKKSKSHKAMSLHDPQIMKQAPMMSALFKQIGFEFSPLPRSDSSILLNKQDKDFGVFIVGQAKGSKLIPAQMEFVEPFGIESVFGFGGMFSNSEVFAVIVFSKKRITAEKAKGFWSLAPALKFAMLENELRGNCFKSGEKLSSKRFSRNLEIAIQSEKSKTLSDELIRANVAFVQLTENLKREIAERKQAEDQTWESKKHFQTIFDRSNDMIFILDPEQDRILNVNDKACSTLGYSHEEFLSLHMSDLHPHEMADLRKFVQSVAKKGGDRTDQLSCRTKTGDLIPAEISASFVEISGESYLVVLVRDIRERKQAETELRESEAKYRQLFSAKSDAILIFDAETKEIIDANNAVRAVFGYGRDEILRLKVTDISAEPEKTKASVDEAAAGKISRVPLRYMKKKDGTVFPVEISTGTFSLNKRRLVFGVYRDITERQRAEEEIKSLSKFPSENPSPVLRVGKNQKVLHANLASLTLLSDWICEKGRMIPPPFQPFVERAFSSNSHQEFEMDFKDRTFLFEVMPVADTDYANIYGHDITERKRKEDELRRVSHQMRLIIEGTSSAVGEDFFRLLVSHLASVLQVRYAFIGELTAEKRKTVRTLAVCANGTIGENFEYLLAGTPCENVVGKTTCIYSEKVQELFPQDQLLVEMGVESYLGVPLFDSSGKPLGILVVMDDKAMTDLANAPSILKIFAARAEAEMERKRAEEALHMAHAELEIRVEQRTADLRAANEKLQGLSRHLQSVREEESTRIAREVHDELGQMLTTLKLELSLLENRFSKKQQSFKDDTQLMLSLVDSTIQTVKRIATELRPEVLDVLGFADAVDWQAQEFQDLTGIQCAFNFNSNDVVLDQARSTATFRIFQEILTNVARHANATAVNIDFQEENGDLILEIRDNGKGITDGQIYDSKSIGLIGMRERALSMGGSVVIVGAPKKGTTVTLKFPHD